MQNLNCSSNKKNIVIAGHDLKFIGEFESYLKQKGYQVKRDLWEWGEPGDETRSEYLAKWADIVFCEWGLANAVWYSQNLDKNKRLVVRIHLQEINERARRFPPKILYFSTFFGRFQKLIKNLFFCFSAKMENE